jgi:hypothetical protein
MVTWYVSSSTGVQVVHWGATGDIPAPADYDGDTVTDFAVFRPSDGSWHVLQSLTNTYRSLQWGQSGDKPVPGDYFFLDGFDEFVLFRPSNGTWYGTTGATSVVAQFGINGDKPAPRDFDADGKLDLTVYRPSTGTWYIQKSHDGSYRIQQWGTAEDIPVPVDMSQPAMPTLLSGGPAMETGTSTTLITTNSRSKHFGQSGDIPQPIDYGTVVGLSDLGNLPAQYGHLVYSRNRRCIHCISVWIIRGHPNCDRISDTTVIWVHGREVANVAARCSFLRRGVRERIQVG